MSAEADVHEVVLELEAPIPAEVPVRSDLVLKVKVSCRRGCDVDCGLVTVVAGDQTLVASVHEALVVVAPATVGACSWLLLFPRQQICGVAHEQASLPIAFATRPLASSLAIWDVRSPVVIGERFSVKVGVKSAAAYGLEGATVEIRDEAGRVVGSGRLGRTPWEGTSALYWTEVELPAPVREGIVVSWLARFPATEMPLPHGEAMARFSVAAVAPPDYRLTITFTDMETDVPIENADIRLGPFRATTDADGCAELWIAAGQYHVNVWHRSYEVPPTTVTVYGDRVLRLQGIAVHQEDPSARWMM